MSNAITRQLPAYRRLMRDGAVADAVVLDAALIHPRSQPSRSTAYRLQVHFDDGSTTTVTRTEDAVALGWPFAGDILPVRYDPNDRSKLEIDRRRSARQRVSKRNRLQAQAVRQARRAFTRKRSPAPEMPSPKAAGTAALTLDALHR